MVRCVAFRCKNFEGQFEDPEGHRRSWHKFPSRHKHLGRFNAWVRAVQRPQWKPSSRSRLCSDHFEANLFYHGKRGRFLKKSAVPSIFHLPPESLTSTQNHHSSLNGSRKTQSQSLTINHCSDSELVPNNSSERLDPSANINSTEHDDEMSYRLISVIALDHSYVMVDDPRWFCPKLKSLTSLLHDREEELQIARDHLRKVYERECREKEIIATLERTTLRLQSKVKKQAGRITTLKRKLKNMRRSRSTLKSKNETLQSCLKEVKGWKLLSNDVTADLQNMTGSFSEVLLRFLTNADKSKVSRKQYPPELRRFALTLYGYSTKSYMYVRTKFAKGLPEPRTIRKWMRIMKYEQEIPTQEFHVVRFDGTE